MFIEVNQSVFDSLKGPIPTSTWNFIQIINRRESTANRNEICTPEQLPAHLSRNTHKIQLRFSWTGIFVVIFTKYSWGLLNVFTTGWNLTITSITVTNLAAPCQGNRPWSPILSPRTFPRSCLEEHSPLLPPSKTRFQIFSSPLLCTWCYAVRALSAPFFRSMVLTWRTWAHWGDSSHPWNLRRAMSSTVLDVC